MTEVVLIRHGETDWNVDGKYTGQTDIPLNDVGEKQALTLAEGLRNSDIHAIYSSDLLRARRTAEILAMSIGASLTLDPRLREINQGDWEGMPYDEIRKKYRGTVEQRQKNPLEIAPPNGENVREVQERVLAAFHSILEAHKDEKIAIVAHGLVLAILRVHFQNLPIEEVWEHIPENARPDSYHVADYG